MSVKFMKNMTMKSGDTMFSYEYTTLIGGCLKMSKVPLFANIKLGWY